MPSPTKVGKPSPGGKKGSVWDRVIDVGDNDALGYKVCLFGRNGSGKTSLACTFPKPLLLVGLEDGTKSVRSVKGVKFVRVWKTADLKEIADGVLEQGFKTVVIDTATSLQDLVLKELLDLDEVPVQLSWGTVTQANYRDRAEKTKSLLRLFLDVADRHPVNCVILGQEKDHSKKGDESATPAGYEDINMPFIGANLGESSAIWLHSSVDYLCQTFTRMKTITTEKVVGKGTPAEKRVKKVQQTDETEFCLRMSRGHPVFAAKVRADRDVEIPTILVNPSYDRFVKCLEGEELED